MERERIPRYFMDFWAEIEAQHENGYFGDVQEMREIDRYQLAHSSRDLTSSVVDFD